MTQHSVAAPQQQRQRSLSDLVEGLSQFQGPPDQFLLHLLAVQCEAASAAGGAVLHVEEGKPQLLAIYPGIDAEERPPNWARQAVQASVKVFQSGRSLTMPIEGDGQLYGQSATHYLILLPLRSSGAVRGAAAFSVTARNQDALRQLTERLELTIGLLSLYEMRLTLQMHRHDLQRVRRTLEVHAAVNEHDRFHAVGMALCNEVASRWSAQRVTIGFRKGRYVHAKSMSHTEKFTRKTQLVQDIEKVMEEALDQDVEVIQPSDREATYVSRAAAEFSQRHGPLAICSMPLRRDGEPVGVLTLERPADRPFTSEEIESLRLTADLCTPRLADLHETDRWIGARAAATLQRGAGALLGPRHTWAKLTVLGVLAAVLFLAFAKGPYRADATFVVEATDYRAVSAPFQGFIAGAPVEPGDVVFAGETTLMQLDTAEMEVRLAELMARRRQHLKQAMVHERDNELSEAQIAQAQADQVTAQIRLLQHQISQANVVAPIDGTIIRGDWGEAVGRPVDLGEPLYEIAPLETLHAELSVPESRVAELSEGFRGQLATAANPGVYIPFEVERISPAAEVVDNRNIFKVRVRLIMDESPLRRPMLMPGMEGVAKVDLGRRNYLWIWSRDLVNWVRMQLWI